MGSTARAQFTAEHRRARLGARHALAPGFRTDDPVDAARAVMCLHATDPATVYLSALARMETGDFDDIAAALYEKRSLIRLLGMRRSVFVMPVELAPVVQAACSHAVAATQRKLLIKDLTNSGAKLGTDVGAWLADVETAVVEALEKRGTATAAQLSADEPRLRTALTYAPDKSYGGTGAITSRVLFLLAADARIVRGRPNGSWTSTQYVWSPIDSWLDGGLPVLGTGAARVELIRHWLSVFGPAPVPDIKWWTGLGLTEVRKALAQLDIAEVDLGDGELGVVLTEDLETGPEPGDIPPWAALLPGLDPTVMGWQSRDWYLGDHAKTVTDRTGNVGPTVWWNGRVVGVWVQRKSGEITYRLLDDIGGEGRTAVDAATAELEHRLGDLRFATKFPAPIGREILAERA